MPDIRDVDVSILCYNSHRECSQSLRQKTGVDVEADIVLHGVAAQGVGAEVEDCAEEEVGVDEEEVVEVEGDRRWRSPDDEIGQRCGKDYEWTQSTIPYRPWKSSTSFDCRGFRSACTVKIQSTTRRLTQRIEVKDDYGRIRSDTCIIGA